MAVYSQSKFYEGIADDIRESSTTKLSYASHFDLWSNPNRATPFKTMVAADATSGSNIRNFIFASDGKVYGLGLNPGTSFMRLFSSDWASFTSWTTAATWSTNKIDTAQKCFNVFFEYKDYLYGVSDTNTQSAPLTKIWRYGPLSGSPSLTETVSTITPTNSATGYTFASEAIIGANDSPYFVLSNKATSNSTVDIVTVDSSGTKSFGAYVPPTGKICTTLSRKGSYLALGFLDNNLNSVGNKSTIKVWDYTSTDSSDTINSTDGELVALGEVDGQLISITQLYRSGFDKNYSTIVGLINGRETDILKTLPNVRPTASRKQVYSGGMYFGGTSYSGSSTASGEYQKTGLYVVGRPSAGYNWSVNQEYQAVASGVSTNPTAVNGFYIVDDYAWISHSTDNVTKISNVATYVNTSVLETLVNPGMPLETSHTTKDLGGFRLNYVALNGGTVVAKYRVDGGSYTTMFSHTTVTGETSFEKVKDTNGSNFGTGREYQFKIESTAGVEITGFDYLINPTTQDQL